MKLILLKHLHFIPLLQVQRSLSFIAWWTLFTVVFRVMITWLYNNTVRSVFAAALCHRDRYGHWKGTTDVVASLRGL